MSVPRIARHTLPILLLSLPWTAPSAQTPVRLADVNATPDTIGGSSEPVPLCVTATRAWFRAADPDHGAEPWYVDATGIRRAADLVPGPVGSDPDAAIPCPSRADDVLFAAYTPASGRELCISDGTAPGTQVLVDLEPGPNGSRPRSFVASGGLVWFVATVAPLGDGVWCTDGTVSGTRHVADLASDAHGGDFAELAAFAGGAVFARDDGRHGVEPWISDGTVGGTRLLADVDPTADSFPAQFVDANGTLFFVAGVYGSAQPSGRELWRSDGTTTGTRLVVDLWPGSNSPDIEQLTALGGDVYFKAAIDRRADELWRSDGTPGGTRMVRDIHPTPGFGSGIRLLTAYAGRLWFVANDPAVGVELFVSDGTTAGTRPVVDLSPASSLPQTIAGAHGRVWFTAQHNGDASRAPTGFELWVTDGTAAGTTLAADIAVGRESSSPGAVLEVPGGATVAFAADDGRVGREPWTSDGTPAGTRLLADVSPPVPGATFGSAPSAAVAVGDLAFFTADDGVHGRELWVTDGTTAGTRLVVDLRPGVAGSDPEHLTSAGGHLWFAADDGNTGAELWRTDGTAAGTRRISDLRAGRAGANPRELTPLRTQLFFAAGVDGMGIELCVVPLDASAAPRLVLDIHPGRSNSDPREMTAFGDRVVFRVYTTAGGFEPWVSDGSAAGTHALREIGPGTASSTPHDFVTLGGRLFFAAFDGSANGSGEELWVSDGTAGGTRLFVDLVPGGLYSYPEQLVPFGDRILFTAARPRQVAGEGREPWVTDGTVAGTRLLRDVVPGPDGSDPLEITPVRPDLALFRASTDATGAELWATDGTPAGTRLVADLEPGDVGSEPGGFVAVGGGALFRARTRVAGDELWFTDGTAANTRRITDLAPGSADAMPRALSVVAGRVFLALDDVRHGSEPWIVRDPLALVEPLGDGCGALARRAWCAPPRLGRMLRWAAEPLDPGSVRLLAIGIPDAGASSVGGCPLFVDPTGPVWFDAATGPGAARFEVGIPDLPALLGVRLALQGFVGANGRVGTTRSLRLVLGN